MLCRQFRLRTELKALAAIIKRVMSVSSRVMKWFLALHPFDLATEMNPRKENVVAHTFSRIPWPLTLRNSDTSDDFVEMQDADSESPSEVGSEPSLMRGNRNPQAAAISRNRHCNVSAIARDGTSSKARRTSSSNGEPTGNAITPIGIEQFGFPLGATCRGWFL